MNKITSFSAVFEVCGRANTPTVIAANGTATAFMKGMRLPPLKLLASDHPAINGSVTASNTRPTAVMMPNSVKPRNSGFVVIYEENTAFSPV